MVLDHGKRLSIEEFGAEFREAWSRLQFRFLKLECWQSYQMAINDRDLLSVPQPTRSVRQRKKDHYCNLILNLQKVAHETGTIELDELRGALRHLMRSPDMYSFWQRARAARMAVTQGDHAEDLFTSEVDRAFREVAPPPASRPAATIRHRITAWFDRPRT